LNVNYINKFTYGAEENFGGDYACSVCVDVIGEEMEFHRLEILTGAEIFLSRGNGESMQSVWECHCSLGILC